MYAKIDPDSADCASSALDLFYIPGTNVGVLNVIFKEFLTLNPVTSSPYHFSIAPTQQLIDLSQTTIESVWTMEISGDNGATWAGVTDADDVSVVQMFGATWMRNVKLTAAGREISNSNNLHAYKVIFDTLLNYDKAAKESHLGVSCFYPDGVDVNAANGPGFLARKGRITNRAHAHFIHNLDVDLFNQPRYFINNIPLDIEIHPNSVEFLTQAPNFVAGTNLARFTLRDLRLMAAFPTLSDSMMVSINGTLERRPAIYHIRRADMKTVFLEAGRTEINVNIFTDYVPRSLTMAMVATNAYNGDYTLSPFNFQPFGIQKHQVEVNGVRYPTVDREMNIAANDYTWAYYELMRNLGYNFNNGSCGITLEQFRNGATIFNWDLTANNKNDTCFELMKRGTTSYHARFRAAIPAGGVTMIFKGDYDAIIKVDGSRSVHTDRAI